MSTLSQKPVGGCTSLKQSSKLGNSTESLENRKDVPKPNHVMVSRDPRMAAANVE